MARASRSKRFAELRIGGERLGQDLDRDNAIETRVARFVDLAHAARAERRDDLVRAETGAGGKRHVCGCPVTCKL